MEMDFSAIIREARTTSGLSQSDLATKAGVGIATIWRLRRRATAPSMSSPGSAGHWTCGSRDYPEQAALVISFEL
jgi:hypothetical protein